MLTMLPEGEDVVVYDALEEYGWYRVSTEEGLGYVSGEYVTIRTEFRVAESKEEEKERLEREEAERQAAAAAAEAARKAREEEERKAAEAARRAEETAKKAEETARKTQKEAAGKAQAEAAGKAQEETAKTAAQQSSEKTQQQTQNAQQAQQKKDKVTQTVSNGQAVVNYADRFVGNPYVYGGSSLTNGADCSGFVMSVYQAFGISLPHSSSALRSVGYGVSLSEIQPGDIVCYSGHVGIYAGNNTLLHASSPSTGIKYTSPVTYREILAIRRIF